METQRLAHRFTTRSEEALAARCGRGRRTDGRRLVLISLLALLLGVSGAAAQTSLAATPDTRVAGIDVDTTTIPELQKLMKSHRLSSVVLTSFYLRRIHQLNPKLNTVITVSQTALSGAH